MAFQIITSKGSQTWFLEQPKPKFPDTPAHESIVLMLQASNKELEVLKRKFKNLPVSVYDTCTWRGEMAQFIYDNL